MSDGRPGRESEYETESGGQTEAVSDRLADAILDLVEQDRRLREPDRQRWERRVGGTDVAEVAIHFDVDDHGRAYVHEAVLAQLLVDAGWDRTA